MNKHTGEEVWKGLSSDEIGYSPPMIYDLAGKRQLVIWLSEALYGLDPATGRQFWKHEYPEGVPVQRPAVNIVTVKKIDDMLFVSSFYHGPDDVESHRGRRDIGRCGRERATMPPALMVRTP